LESYIKDDVQHTPSNNDNDQNRTKFYFVEELLTTEKSPKRRDKNEKQLLVILMITIVLATVFVTECWRCYDSTSLSPVVSSATTTSKISATTITPTMIPTAHTRLMNYSGDSCAYMSY